MTLHFAYGANMDRAGMARRCPSAVPVGIAVLEGYRVLVTVDGYANVAPAAGESVHGVLWRLKPRDLAALNAFESLDSGLYRRVMLPVRMGDRRVNALVYVGRTLQAGRPRPGYLDLVIAAARDWNLPPDYVAGLERMRPGGRRAARAAEARKIG